MVSRAELGNSDSEKTGAIPNMGFQHDGILGSPLNPRASPFQPTRELPRDSGRRRQRADYPEERNPKNCYDRSGKTLPQGWLDCPAFGQCVGEYIIPSKVPLDETYNDCIGKTDKRYSWRQVIGKNRDLLREIGLVIDLTNSNRYYNPFVDLRNNGIKHVKIACKGRDSVPDNESVNTFVYEAMQFRFQFSEKFMVVHCTHGHNRTGFMIVHYLMRSQLVYSVTEALQIFASARPPGIYKEDYIQALYTFYHETRPDYVVCPSTPDWKRDSGDDDDGVVIAPLLLQEEDNVQNGLLSNDDVLGDVVPFEQQDRMRYDCYRMLKLNPQEKGYSRFPGSHPVSLNRENLQLLRQKYYYTTWKADGTRYMMLITCDGCYLIDRNFCFRRIQMRFPSKQTNEAGTKDPHYWTLLDGEMVIDTQPDTFKQERRYLIYDMMATNQMPIEGPFGQRWKMVEKEVIEPRNIERHYIHKSSNPCYRYDLEPFRVRRKDFWLLSTVTKLLKEFIPKLPHEADGLIFQGWNDEYVTRTDESLLKWKFPEMNSVDFRFKVLDEKRQLLFLNERGREKLMEGSQVVFRDGSDPLLYSGKVIECSWDFEEEVWVYMRVRVDKNTPNEINTYRKVMRSIKDNITEDVLLGELHEIVRLPMYVEGIRNDTKASAVRRK
ncbi:hypothetical protein GIB67_020826 [Kingdonia uniflora]|uniref:mRNA guanylyltransferase n=1 Tax=Kingdonia uniflora TaxID=39325 RepID=A0A7J7M794_9MAGN|nr:hypothetical protein GIB67_020826 [Kingdonia uniflora]